MSRHKWVKISYLDRPQLILDLRLKPEGIKAVSKCSYCGIYKVHLYIKPNHYVKYVNNNAVSEKRPDCKH